MLSSPQGSREVCDGAVLLGYPTSTHEGGDSERVELGVLRPTGPVARANTVRRPSTARSRPEEILSTGGHDLARSIGVPIIGMTGQRHERASLWCLVELAVGVQHLTRTSSMRRGDLM